MKAGDLVRVKNPTFLITGEDEAEARARYPWKFEVGVVIDAEPYGSMNGLEAYVCFPSKRMKTIMTDSIEVISESR